MARTVKQKLSEESKRRRPARLRAWASLWLPLAMLSLVPLFSSYLENTSETSVQDLLLPLCLNLLVVTIVAGVAFWFYLRDRFTLYLTTVLVTLILTNSYESKIGTISNVINSALPFTVSVPLLSLGYLIVMIYIVYRLARLVSRLVTGWHWSTKEITAGITILIAVVFLSQFVPTVRNLAAAWPQYFYKPPALTMSHPTSAELAAKPDIYYILLEDYASDDVLKNQMNFDNSDFLQYLSTNGFYNLPGANSNYPYTVNSVASTFSAGYLSDEVNKFSTSANQTMIPYFQAIRYSPVIQQLKSWGYTYDLLGDWYETSNYSPLANNNYVSDDEILAFNHTYNIDDFTDTQIQQNVLWGIIQRGLKLGSYRLLGYNTQSDINLVASQLSELKTLAAAPAGGRFIFSQILVPHNYFYFNADGSLNDNPTPDNAGEPAKVKDTDEIQFINSQIEPIITKIMSQSHGKADIILQSDEGPEPAIMNYTGFGTPNVNKTKLNMSQWSTADLQMKFGVLASYYLPSASPAAMSKGANPVNIFRLLLNSDFNASLPYLPECYYGYPQGTNESFVYSGINQALTGQSNQSCPANSNFIAPGPSKLIKSPKRSSNSDDD